MQIRQPVKTSQRKQQLLTLYFMQTAYSSYTSLLKATIALCFPCMFLFVCVLAKCAGIYIWTVLQISFSYNCLHLLLCFQSPPRGRTVFACNSLLPNRCTVLYCESPASHLPVPLVLGFRSPPAPITTNQTAANILARVFLQTRVRMPGTQSQEQTWWVAYSAVSVPTSHA